MNWTPDELARVGAADELQIASYRPDGSLRRWVTIWVVRSGDDVFVRSAYGPQGGWFRNAVDDGAGRIRSGGVERDVSFTAVAATDDAHADIDAAYHAKYDKYDARVVNPVVGEAVRDVTLRLVPSG